MSMVLKMVSLVLENGEHGPENAKQDHALCEGLPARKPDESAERNGEHGPENAKQDHALRESLPAWKPGESAKDPDESYP